MEKTRTEIRALLGKRVQVLLDYGGHPDPENPPVISVGEFLGFGSGGDFEILEDDGFVHYCWPMLQIEAVGDIDVVAEVG